MFCIPLCMCVIHGLPLEQLEVYREMVVLARTHPGLAEELERVKMYYYLLKQQDDEVFWHPV